MLGDRLTVGPPQTLLPADHPDLAVAELLGRGSVEVLLEDTVDPDDLRQAAAQYPASSLAWALLARAELADGATGGDAVAGYAFARVGYHRGLDALRRAGWRGQGPIPVTHLPNRGFLAALLALGEAADRIGEHDEAARIADFLHQSDPAAADALSGGIPLGEIAAG